jgi:hypothetical protein
MSIKDAHLLGNIGDAPEIEQSQQKTVQDRQHTGSLAFADLTMIFAQRHVASPMQTIFKALPISTTFIDRKQLL